MSELLRDQQAQRAPSQNFLSPTVEETAVVRARIEDLNQNLVRQHITTTIERRGYQGSTDEILYLQDHGCIVPTEHAFTPTIAGMLMFTTEPERWLAMAGVDIVQFSGDRPHPDKIVFSQQVRGDLVDVINRTVEALWVRSEHRYWLVGSERREAHAYARPVLRELTVNALCHRDWSISGSLVRIQMFPDSIEWVTPGGLPDRIDIRNLRTAQQTRNPKLARLLYNAGLVERFGMGIDLVLDTLEAMGCREPDLSDDGFAFSFRVWGKELDTESARAPLDLSPRQQRVLEIIRMRGASTSADIADAMNEARRNIQRDLHVLMSEGLLTVEGATTKARYRLRAP